MKLPAVIRHFPNCHIKVSKTHCGHCRNTPCTSYTNSIYRSTAKGYHRISSLSWRLDGNSLPSQLVTASFHSFTSCCLVPPKWSTNSGPKTSASRAMLSGLIILSVADSNDVDNSLTYSEEYISPMNTTIRTRTFPFFLSSGVRWLMGGPGNWIFFSIPLRPNKKMALRAKYGFISAPGMRTSNLVAAGGTEGGEMMRIDAARES
jgi:hypothetical protein